jgi:hypothetical protein
MQVGLTIKFYSMLSNIFQCFKTKRCIISFFTLCAEHYGHQSLFFCIDRGSCDIFQDVEASHGVSEGEMITLMREINLNHHGDDMRVGQTRLIPMHSRNIVKLK